MSNWADKWLLREVYNPWHSLAPLSPPANYTLGVSSPEIRWEECAGLPTPHPKKELFRSAAADALTR